MIARVVNKIHGVDIQSVKSGAVLITDFHYTEKSTLLITPDNQHKPQICKNLNLEF